MSTIFSSNSFGVYI
ncbi:hypothetical protein PWA37_004767 [Arxiozyma heterogenica]